jgi:hypothetical protein
MWKDGEEGATQRVIDCVRQNVREMAVSYEMTSDRGEWMEKTCCVDPK